jgi:hypothetical protein
VTGHRQAGPLARRLAAVALALLAVAAAAPAGGPIAAAGAYTVLTAPDTSPPIPVSDSTLPPPEHRLSADQVLAIAARLPAMRRLTTEYPGSYAGAYLKGSDRWQVSTFTRDGRKEVGQVLIADRTARVLEVWTGFQVAWTMARGYPGAFGQSVNAWYVWIPLTLLFCFPFVDWRRPRRMLHLDLLALCSFSVSLAFFNHADIGLSVPLAYPPLIYLLVRMLMVARPGRRRGPAPPAERLHLNVSPAWLAVAIVFLVGFRIGLNVANSNVIDVGYAGVIGAHRIVHGEPLYAGWPAGNPHGDTYGPVSYEAYVPFVALFGWSGRWDDLPAAHAAAIVFDLLALVLCYLLGRRVRGPTLGLALAFAWAANPFTLYALESNTNDGLVAALVLVAVLVATGKRVRPGARGVTAALAGLTKFAPLALAPLLATHGLSGSPRVRLVAILRFAVAFALCAAVVGIPALTHSSLRAFWESTLVYQANRGSPFSVWGLYGGLAAPQVIVEAAAVALAVALAVLPRRPDAVGLAAACAAVLLALQLGVDHWFYLYIPWFAPLVMLALLGRYRPAEADEEPLLPFRIGARPPAAAVEPEPEPAATPTTRAAAAAPARWSRLAGAWTRAPRRPSATGRPRRSRSAPACW